MTEQEVNRILAEFEGWNKIPNSYMEQMQRNDEYKYLFDFGYTYDWNDFHRVFFMYAKQGGFLMKFHELLLNETPSLAAHKLAEIVNQHTTN